MGPHKLVSAQTEKHDKLPYVYTCDSVRGLKSKTNLSFKKPKNKDAVSPDESLTEWLKVFSEGIQKGGLLLNESASRPVILDLWQPPQYLIFFATSRARSNLFITRISDLDLTAAQSANQKLINWHPKRAGKTRDFSK